MVGKGLARYFARPADLTEAGIKNVESSFDEVQIKCHNYGSFFLSLYNII